MFPPGAIPIPPTWAARASDTRSPVRLGLAMTSNSSGRVRICWRKASVMASLTRIFPAGGLPPHSSHGTVRELALGERIPPLHEHAFGVLLDVPLVDQGDVPPLVLDGVPHGGADEPLRAFLRDRLDADRAGGRKADLLDAHLALEELDDLAGLRRPRLPLDPGVDVVGVLPEDDHVHLLGVLDRGRHALVPADGPEADVEVQLLAQRHVEAPEPLADRRGERPLDRHQVLP